MNAADFDELSKAEKQHLYQCSRCGEMVDKRQLDDVLFHEDHVHRPDIQYGGSQIAQRKMNAEPDDALLSAFARAASQAQEIEALLQEMLIAAEVANDTKNRSFEDIAAKIENLPLGMLKARFLEVVRVDDPLFAKMWKEINEER